MGKKQSGAARIKDVVTELPAETELGGVAADPATADVLLRLRKIEGQIRGIHKMIEEGKNHSDVINQLAAVRKALNKAGIILITNQLQTSLADPEKSDKSKEKTFDETLKQYLTLA